MPLNLKQSVLATTLTAATTFSLAPMPAIAQVPDKPGWACLPADALGVIRMPGGKAYLEAMKAQTQLGQLLFNQARVADYAEAMKDAMGEDFDEMVEGLASVGLKPEDFAAMFNRAVGMGVVHQARQFDAPDGTLPLFHLVGWVDADADLAHRVAEAMDRGSQQAIAEDDRIQRVDLELQGQPVMHLTFPEEGFAAEQEDTWMVVDQTHLMFTRVGDRLVFVMSPPQSAEMIAPSLLDDLDVDWETITGVPEIIQTTARFIAAHGQNGEGFAGRILSEPGVDAAIPQGVPAMFGFLQVGDLYRLLQANAGVEAESLISTLSKLGLNDTGTLAFGITQDGQVARSNVFLGAPAPRQGLWGLLDQPELSPEPAAWVPDDVTSYGHVGIDYRASYDKIKALVLDTVGPAAEQAFAQAEVSFEQFTQTPLTDFLGTMGDRVAFVSYPPTLVEVERPDFSQDPDPDTGQYPTIVSQEPRDRGAYVLDIGDKALWDRVFQALAPFAAMGGETVQAINEQGFTGWQIDSPDGVFTVVLGERNLVVCQGQDVLPRVLTALNNPPAADRQLAKSPRFTETAEHMDLRSGVLVGLMDTNQLLQTTLKTIGAVLETNGGLEEQGLQLFLDLMPTAEELEGVIKESLQQSYTTQDGIVFEQIFMTSPRQ